MDAHIMVETEDFSSNNTWMKMFYQPIHDSSQTPVFKTVVPASASTYLRYKIKFRFRDESIGETAEWRTLITEYKNNTKKNTNTIDIKNDNNKNLILFIAITCIIIVVKYVYDLSRAFMMWFNK